MNFPPQYREHSLPSIIVPSADRLRGNAGHHDMPFGRSPAMSIPGLHQHTDAPPPLPPPRYLPGTEPRTQDGMREKRDHGYGPPSFATSGYGSIGSSFAEEAPNYQRRDKHSDEGYASFSSTDRSRDSGPTEFGLLHNHYRLRSAADDGMMKKLDPMRSSERSPPRSLLSASANELLPRRPSAEGRFPSLSLPIHTRNILASPARLDTPQHSTLSPRSTPFHYGERSPKDGSDLDRSPRTRVKRNNSDDASSTQGSFDFNAAEDMDMEDTQSLKRLHIDDAYSAGGLKRRAASPPDEHLLMGQVDAARRREMGSRGSPTPRLSTIPQGSSLSSMPSTSRSNSYMSTMSMPASSITTANSYGRRSPNGLSTGGISPTSCNSPYATSSSLNPSPRASISGRGSIHSRNVSNASARKLNEVQKPGSSKMQSIHMCECCPKKPKRFDTAEELSAHEAEKQYECSFCGNRFKNKNEMERHQNSLHVRRHSWSCSALSGYDRAFHDSTNRPGEADSCGYCGEEFARSGLGPGTGALSGGSPPRIATEQDWDERIRHLQEVHKFRECNSSKKFYRADHFRQHLKHSHAGTSGKWTNMLENACMLEEDPTPR